MITNLILKSARYTLRLKYFFGIKSIPVPHIADSVTEGTINKFNKSYYPLSEEGDFIDRDQTIAFLQSDKLEVEIKSPDPGLITKIYAKQGETVYIGKALFDLETDVKKPVSQELKIEGTKPPSQKPAQKKTQQKKPVQITPPKQQQKKLEKTKQKTVSTPAPKVFQSITRQQKKVLSHYQQPLSRLRKKIAQRLKEAQNTCALLTTFQQVDMSKVIKIRKELGEQFIQKHGVKLGFNSFFVKGVVACINQNPIVNSAIVGNEIVHRNFIDISVAVATPSGLLVPVIRNCHILSFAQIERELMVLAKKGRQGKITLQEMSGGTFTISNGGVFGSLMGTPIINIPQSAILGLHAIINRPVVVGQSIVARPMMYLALTYDHRILDGKDSALFLKKLQGLIQNPDRLLLDL